MRAQRICRCALTAMLAVIWLAPVAHATSRFASSACIAKPEGEACEKLAREISADINAVRELGDELEQRERYNDATAIYRVALTMHPNNRDLTQRLINARGQARSANLIAGLPSQRPTPDTGALAPAVATAAPAATTRAATANSRTPVTGAAGGTRTANAAVGAAPPPANLRTRQAVARDTAAATANATASTLPPDAMSGARQAAANEAPSAQALAAAGVQPSLAAARDRMQATKLEPPGGVPIASQSGRYLALVIGNEQYADFTKLRTPLADVRALAALLTREYGFEVKVLANATRYQIVSALSKLRQQATENDNVLIYYAGHGYLDESTSRGYWLPVDAEHDNIANWLSTSDITDVLAGLQARHALILADSCFSGTLLRGDLTISIDERQSMLRKLSMQRSRSIMTSGGLEPVIDNGAGPHSIFADAVIKVLSDNRRFLEAGRLFMEIRDHVAARAAQTPQYAPLRNAGHDGGDFIFVRNPTN
jgi:uncharacterized caspase-like protein